MLDSWKKLWPAFVLGMCVPVVVLGEEPATEAQPAEITAQQEKPNFIRIKRDDRGKAVSMETAVVRYAPSGAAPAQAADPRVNLAGQDGNTALHLAAAGGHVDAVRELLSRGARSDAENAQGLTPLHMAAEKGHADVIKLLLENRPAPAPGGIAVPAGVTIDLIGVVHIGEKEYYTALDESFKQYDALLYELVAPKGTRVPRDPARRKPGSAIGMMQSGMTDVLDLDFQLHHIDYHAENFVHADMSPEEFEAAMNERGESWWKMALQSMGHSMAEQTKPGATKDTDFLAALFADNQALALKRVMANQFEDLEGQMKMFGGEKGSTIIHARNLKALEVLREQIAAGKKKIGIFYGAGHMPDFHEHLVKDYGLKPIETDWHKAWDLKE